MFELWNAQLYLPIEHDLVQVKQPVYDLHPTCIKGNNRSIDFG